jgi:BMFP domain-containing protein YqiC
MEPRQKLDDLVQEFLRALPEDLGKFRADLEQNARAAFRAALARTELVTREEFDVQAALLSRTRALVDELERKVRELEARSERGGNAD